MRATHWIFTCTQIDAKDKDVDKLWS